MKVQLVAVLEAYANDALLAIARRQGVLAIAGKHKEDVIQTLSRTLGRPEAVTRALASINKRDREALDRLVLHGGKAYTRSFEHELELRGLVSPDESSYFHEGSAKDSDSARFLDMIARLTAWGLVLSDLPYADGTTSMKLGTPGGRLFIPDAVLALLPPVKAVAPQLPPVEVSQTIEARPEVSQRDLWLYWRFVRHDMVELTARASVPKRQLAKIVDCLVEREPLEGVSAEQELGRTFFLRAMLHDIELLSVTPEGRLVANEETAPFFGMPGGKRTQRCYQAWLESRRWTELRRVKGLSVRSNSSPIREAPPQFADSRRFIAQQLAKMPADRWILFDHFVKQVELTDYEFLFRSSAGSRYNRYKHSDLYAYGNPFGWTLECEQGQPSWKAVEGRFIMAVVAEPLHWLGLVDLGYQDGSLAAFRLTAFGRTILRDESAAEVEAGDMQHVVVQPNFQIFAFDPISEEVLSRLDDFADLVRADKAIEFRLTRESVYRAQRAGVLVPSISEFLEQVSGRELPQNVRRTLEEWAGEHDRIVVRRNVSVLQAASAELLDGLFATGNLAKHLGRRIAPTSAVVANGEAVPKLVGALFDKGHIPAVEEDGAATGKPVGGIRPDGGIFFRQALPSMYVWRRLWSFTEDRDGVLIITAKSVKKAVQSGLSTDEVIRRLEDVHYGPLGTPIVDRIKAWANHWGDAALGSLTFLRVKDARVLAELMEDQAVSTLLRPFPAEGALALVRDTDVDRLRKALEEKGVTVGELDV